MCLSASCAWFLLRKRPIAFPVVPGAIFMIGALTTQARGISSVSSPTPVMDAGDIIVTAHVTSEGNVQSDGTGGFHERVEVETEKTEWENQFFKNHIGVMLSLYSANGSARSDAQGGTGAIGGNRIPLLHYGQRIRFRAALNPPRNYRNPGAVDYAGYLRDCGITALASTKAADLELLPGFSGSRPELWRARVHRSS
jgi:Domain of unknown function (DUF4131)